METGTGQTLKYMHCVNRNSVAKKPGIAYTNFILKNYQLSWLPKAYFSGVQIFLFQGAFNDQNE